jgi:hypothetical protein
VPHGNRTSRSRLTWPYSALIPYAYQIPIWYLEQLINPFVLLPTGNIEMHLFYEVYFLVRTHLG